MLMSHGFFIIKNFIPELSEKNYPLAEKYSENRNIILFWIIKYKSNTKKLMK